MLLSLEFLLGVGSEKVGNIVENHWKEAEESAEGFDEDEDGRDDGGADEMRYQEMREKYEDGGVMKHVEYDLEQPPQENERGDDEGK